jgi:hypothetical protein
MPLPSHLAALALCLGCSLSAALAAQAAPTALGIEDLQAGVDPVRVAGVSVEATVTGGQSVTRMELVVHNPSARVRGGNLTVPLPADATVIGYQLEVDGVMVDGVPVPKARATEVYETILRRGTDPGLVEQVQGNVFHTRVFPINPGQSRRVAISWSANLSGTKADQYRLPLRFAAPVPAFSLKLAVTDISQPPKLAAAGLDGLDMVAWESGYRAAVQRQNVKLDCTLELTLPRSGFGQPLVESIGRDHWFSVLLPTPSAAGGRAAWVSAVKPVVTLYLDASHSRSDCDTNALAQILAKTAGLVGKSLTVKLVVFRDEPEAVREYTVSPGDAGELRRVLELVDFDGGSRFDRLPAPAPGSLAFFFTDALPTLGDTLPAWQAADAAVLLSGPVRDSAIAARLAGPGGRVLDLDAALADTLALALTTPSTAPRLRLISGEAVDLLLAHPAGDDNRLVLAGRLIGRRIELEWGPEGRSQRLTIDDSAIREGGLARFAWAGLQLQALQSRPDAATPAGKERISAFGMEYGLVTPGTSLLVLETLEQYLEFDIKPPSSLPAWEKAWRQQSDRKKADEKRALERRIDDLAAQWRERIAWWQRDFSKVPDKLPPEAKEKKEGGSLERSADSAPAPRAMAAAAPAMDRAEPAAEAKVAADKDGAPELAAAGREAAVSVQAWSPDRPYLRELKAAGQEGAYPTYLKLKRAYPKSPAFFIEMGDWFAGHGRPELAKRIWTTIADLGYRDSPMLRILANRLVQSGEAELAAVLFGLVRDDRPFEPQSHRDLALALAAGGRFKEAVPLLWQVATGAWQRTRGIELLALMEFNRYLPEAVKQGLSPVAYDKRLVKLLDVDLRIVMAWDADNTDQDLWVTEPSGFRVSYAATASPHGGRISNDITDGFGPEEYLIRAARKGSYRIETNYYGSRSPELTGAATLFVTIFTNYGRANEKKQSLTLQLEGSGDTFLIGTAAW